MDAKQRTLSGRWSIAVARALEVEEGKRVGEPLAVANGAHGSELFRLELLWYTVRTVWG